MTGDNWITTPAGVEMPPIVYGTAWKEERTADLVELAVGVGFRGVDTAGQPRHYDEARVGEALARVKGNGVGRDDLFIQTKFTPLQGQDPARVPYDKSAPPAEQVLQSFETSKKNLRTGVVDSLVLHSPVSPYEQLLEVWGAMEEIHAAGGARQLGISNCYHAHLLEALYKDAGVKPAVVQNRFYPMTGYDVDVRRICGQHGIVYQSFWTLTANPHVLESEVVRTIAGSHERTEAQVFFRYLTQVGIVPLTGTTSERHMREDLAIFDFELGPDELSTLGRLVGEGG